VTQGNLLQAVIAASGGLNFGSSAVTISADAVTNSPQNAQALEDVLKFLVSMLQSNAQNKPALGALASSATFSINGAVMHLAMSLPEEQIEQLFVPGGAGAKKRIAAR
jgi:glycine cleavage system regulatory protein